MTKPSALLNFAIVAVGSLLNCTTMSGFLGTVVLNSSGLLQSLFCELTDKEIDEIDELTKTISREIQALTISEEPSKIQSAALLLQEKIATTGISYQKFAELSLDPSTAAQNVLEKIGFSNSDAIEIKPVCERLLESFYKSVISNESCFKALNVEIQRTLLRNSSSTLEGISRLEKKFDNSSPLRDPQSPNQTHLKPNRPDNNWIGRKDEIEQLKSAMLSSGSQAVCQIIGMGGVGKTALANEIANLLHSEKFPDGVLYVDLKSFDTQVTMTTHQAMRYLVRKFGYDGQIPDDPTAVYQKSLHGFRLLLILDNALDKGQIESLLLPEPAAVIITSRNEIDLLNGTKINLSLLSEEQSISLLKTRLKEKSESLDLNKLANLCGQLPIMLCVIGDTLYKSRVLTSDQIIERLEAASDMPLSVEKVIKTIGLSLDVLNDDNQLRRQQFDYLAVMKADFGLISVKNILNVSQFEAENIVEDFFSRSLIMESQQRYGEKRFRIQDLIRSASWKSCKEHRKMTLTLAVAHHFLEYLNWIDINYCSGTVVKPSALQIFYMELPNFENCLELLKQYEWQREALSYIARYPLTAPATLRATMSRERRIFHLEAAVHAAQRLEAPTIELKALGNLGVVYAEARRFNHALRCLDRQMELSEENEDKEGYCKSAGNKARLHLEKNEPYDAIPALVFHLRLVRGQGHLGYVDFDGQAQALHNLAHSLFRIGKNKCALKFAKASTAIAENHGLWIRFVEALTVSAEIEMSSGNASKSIIILKHAKLILESNDVSHRLNQVTLQLAYAYHRNSQHAEKVDALEESIDLAENMVDQNAKIAHLTHCAIAMDFFGYSERAKNLMQPVVDFVLQSDRPLQQQLVGFLDKILAER